MSADNSHIIPKVPLRAFTVAILLTLLLCLAPGLQVWESYQDYKATLTVDFRLRDLSRTVTHLSEVLSMSAQMAVATGEARWEKRYRDFAPKLEAAIKESAQLSPNFLISQSAMLTYHANERLAEIEQRAFQLAAAGQKNQALGLLSGAEYEEQKRIYARGIKQIDIAMETRSQENFAKLRRFAWFGIGSRLLAVPILRRTWRGVLRLLHRYLARRDQAEARANLLRTTALLISESKDFPATLKIILQKICESSGWVLGQAWLVDAAGRSLRCSTAWFAPTTGLEDFRRASESMTFQEGQGLPGRTWREKKPVWIENATLERNFPRVVAAQAAGLKAAVGVPVLLQDKVAGVMEFFLFERREEDVDFAGLASAVAAQVGSLIQRKQAEEALARERDLLSAFLSNVPDRIYFKDPESRVVRGKLAPARRLGLEQPEDMIGKTDFDFHPADQAAEFFADEQAILKTGAPLINKVEKQSGAGGTALWASVTKVPFFDTDGKIIGLIGVSRDITDLKRAEETLRVSEARFRSIWEGAGDGMRLTDAAGIIRAVNPAFCGIVGMVEAELVGQPYTITFAEGEPTAPRLERFRERFAKRTVKQRAQRQLVFRSGKEVNVEISNSYVASDNETLLLSIFHDTTERKMAEEEIRRTRSFFNSVVENLPITVFIKDARDLRFVLWNKAGEELTGYSNEEFFVKTDYDFLPKDEADFFTAKDRETLRSGTLVDIPQEINHTRHKGERILHTRKIPILDENGEPRYLLGIAEDITERRQAEEKLRLFAAQLEQNNRELQDFTYVASHDLQEPLRKVRAFGDRLKGKFGAALGEEGRDYLERMQNAARRMQALIDDLLLFSRVTTKGQPFLPVDLNQLVSEVLSDLEIRLEQVKGKVVLEKLPVIRADPTQMRQLFQNLIWKALKYHRKDVPPLVRIYEAPPTGRTDSKSDAPLTDYCVIHVEDNGIGFDEKYVDRIFNVFQRLHGRTEYEGTGVGLAICRKIVVRHGGEITARSQPGQGSTFILKLPTRQVVDGKKS